MVLYSILELENHRVGTSVIIAAWKRLSLVYHPDKAPEEEREEANARTAQLNGAKEVLADVARRVQYHEDGKLPWDA